jgi:adenine-specific DNA-methyltransferase
MSAYSTLSKEQLITEIKRLKKGKKFGLLWEDKPEDVAELCKTKLPVLVDVCSPSAKVALLTLVK